jgi:hypothetical protein
MRLWTASLVTVLLVAYPAVADAQPNCEGIPRGPARTDCYLGLSQFYRAQSDLAADRALAQSDAGNYRNRPSEIQTTSATTRQQVARTSHGLREHAPATSAIALAQR